ncbi:HAD family hydrolase [bacterium]|nr:HAD family hydrolase [bacterium]
MTTTKAYDILASFGYTGTPVAMLTSAMTDLATVRGGEVKLLSIFDLDGNITDATATYHQVYCELFASLVCRRVEGAKAYSLDEFRTMYRSREGFAQLFFIDLQQEEGVMRANDLRAFFELKIRVLRQHDPNLDHVPTERARALKEMMPHIHGIIVSNRWHTHQVIANELAACGLVTKDGNDALFDGNRMYFVGDGLTSTVKAKSDCYVEHFGGLICAQQRLGGYPFAVGDSTSDAEAAYVAGIRDFGATLTGAADRETWRDFRRNHSGERMRLWIFDSIADPTFVKRVIYYANQYDSRVAQVQEAVNCILEQAALTHA